MRVDIEKFDEKPKNFISPTHGPLTLKEVIFRIGQFIHADPAYRYQVIIGTDSQEHGKYEVDFVSAIIVHKIGAGGIYFWQREKVNHRYVLRERIYEEATRSLMLAQTLLEEFEREGFLNFNLEIHVDIGEQGETRVMINEVVGMIRGSGFAVKVKPEAFGAAKVADRHT